MNFILSILLNLIIFLSYFQSLESSVFIERKLNSLELKQEYQDLILDYINQVGSYRDWESVKSIKLDGILYNNENVYEVSLIKKYPNKVRLVARKSGKQFPQLIQIQNGNTSYYSIQYLDGTIKEIDPIFDLSEEMNLMPKLMHLLTNNIEKMSVSKNQDAQNSVVYDFTINDGTAYSFTLNKNTKSITEYSIKKNGTDLEFELKGEIKSSRLKYPRQVIYGSANDSTKLIFKKFDINIGIPEYLFQNPKDRISF